MFPSPFPLPFRSSRFLLYLFFLSIFFAFFLLFSFSIQSFASTVVHRCTHLGYRRRSRSSNTSLSLSLIFLSTSSSQQNNYRETKTFSLLRAWLSLADCFCLLLPSLSPLPFFLFPRPIFPIRPLSLSRPRSSAVGSARFGGPPARVRRLRGPLRFGRASSGRRWHCMR